jgi:hypothetical protein
MSRDGESNRRGANALLTAYVDGVAELAPDERRQVEAELADDPAARAEQAAVRALLDRLRAPAVASPASEPSWAAMEQAIRGAVGPDVPRPWWRLGRWVAPITALAAGATALVLWLAPGAATDSLIEAPRREPVVSPAARDVVALWLEGAEVEVDLSTPSVANLLDGAEGALAAFNEPLDQPVAASGRDVDAALDPELEPEVDAVDGSMRLLPDASLAWVDHLDGDALDRAERWLDAPAPARKPPAQPAARDKRGG